MGSPSGAQWQRQIAKQLTSFKGCSYSTPGNDRCSKLGRCFPGSCSSFPLPTELRNKVALCLP